MRKILSILICIICLGFSSVSARANVTNQLDEISAQLENLDQVLQWFVDNEANLDWWVDMGFWDEYLSPSLSRLTQIAVQTQQAYVLLITGIAPDIASIQADVAALSADLAVYVSQIVASINGVTFEIDDLHQWLIAIGLDRIQYMLTQAQLDDSLNTFLSNFLNNLDFLDDYSSLLGQILQSIQSLDYSYQVEDALYNIAQALNNLENITVTIDLQEQLDNLDLNLDLDLGTALSGLESDLSNILNTLYNFSSAFNYFLQNFQTLQADQLHMFGHLTQFIDWYQGNFFDGLQTWGTRHSEWMSRFEEIAESEAEYRDKQEEFLTGEASFPTDSDVSYLVELEEALIEDEIEVPDEKIYDASEGVKTDLEEVEHELSGAMDVVDDAFTGFLGDVKFNWGSFNPVLSFSYTLPFHSYTLELSYDFSKSDLRAPCRTASTGIWGIVLFVQSFLAISGALRGVTEN